MLREQIKEDIILAIRGQRLEVSGGIEVTRTADPKFGDFATNIALKIAHGSKQSPLEVAKKLADSLQGLPYIKKLQVAGPGFINFWVRDEIWHEEVEKVLKDKDKYGANTSGRGKKARIEFVSANPTGPLHFGNARGAPIGDCLASVLAFCGYEVLREYIHNDIGGQVTKLGETIANVAAGQKLEDQEYKGEYIRDLVEQITKSKVKSQKSKVDPEEAGKLAVDMILDEILADCEAIGIKFDKVFPESGFIESGQTEKALEKLKSSLKQKDGATWFAPNDEFLKDRETVVIKSDGDYTYFANDIAYHNLKFSENPDLVVDVFGANHHGHVPRLKAAISALGYDATKFHVILYQWVRFKSAGKILAMSKRSGTFITAKEILDEVGSDALRFFILMHDPNSHIDFDLDLAREKTSKNPVYYVQYASARIHGILANSKLQIPNSKIDFGLLTTDYELALIKKISMLPELVEDISKSFAVNGLTTYATALADSFHKFYENCQVLTEDKELSAARLALIEATKITLANTLNLLGIWAPEKM